MKDNNMRNRAKALQDWIRNTDGLKKLDDGMPRETLRKMASVSLGRHIGREQMRYAILMVRDDGTRRRRRSEAVKRTHERYPRYNAWQQYNKRKRKKGKPTVTYEEFVSRFPSDRRGCRSDE